jgi:hypothetical protein
MLRRVSGRILSAIAGGIFFLSACSSPHPPTGRWQGFYDGADVMIGARLEISNTGAIRVSAPNAMADFTAMSDEDRKTIHDRLETGLAQSWPHVEPIALDFDGKDFHKPGGVAPQLEWDASAKAMTLIFYSGTHPSVRVMLVPVADFGDDS